MTVNPSKLEKFLKPANKQQRTREKSQQYCSSNNHFQTTTSRADLAAFYISETSKHQHPDILGWEPSNKPLKTLDQLWQHRTEEPIRQSVDALPCTSEKVYTMRHASFKNYHVVPPLVQAEAKQPTGELMPPKQRRACNEQESMSHLARKEMKEAIREKKRLVKLAASQYRNGILGSEDAHQEASQVYGDKCKQTEQVQTWQESSLQVRRNKLTLKDENPVGRQTWQTSVQIEKAAPSEYDGGEKLFPSQKRTEWSEKMQSSENVKEIWKPKERDYSQNEARLRHIFYEQNRNRGFNIINGAILEVPLTSKTNQQ